MIRQKYISDAGGLKLFEHRDLVVASKHKKEHIMEPVIRRYIDINTMIVPDFDTDMFGTFSGEIERPFDAVTTLRKKILGGLTIAKQTLGIGNEGTFGPHPEAPFVSVDQEIVMLIDLQHNIEITESAISFQTNHAQRKISKVKDLIEFTQQVHFPSHGIILKQVKEGTILKIRKGILNWDVLYSVYLDFTSSNSDVIAESDMRSYMNPTRMKTIEKATELLMKKVSNLCPQCGWPGFGAVSLQPGLPCGSCGEPTKLTLSKVYQCKNCSYTDERFYTEGQNADAQYCDYCNP